MNILAICGSPRPNGNSSFLTDQALEEAAANGCEVEKIMLCQHKINPCLGHDPCRSYSSCKIDDDLSAILDKFPNRLRLRSSNGLRVWQNQHLVTIERPLLDLQRRNENILITGISQEMMEILTKKPIVPSETEVNSNPRSRSAKLRIAQRRIIENAPR